MVTTVSRQQANTGGPDCRVSTETSDLLSPVIDSLPTHARVQAHVTSLSEMLCHVLRNHSVLRALGELAKHSRTELS